MEGLKNISLKRQANNRMSKGTWIRQSEKEKIISLHNSIGNKKQVARMVNRDPAAIRKLTKPKPNPKFFNWKDFNNSVI
jgi:hypothetical protein